MAISSPLQSKVPTGSVRTIKKLQGILLNRTKVKREIFQRQTILQSRREENERRKQREDELEAPNLVIKPRGAAGLIAGSAKGFFERLVGFLSYLTAGWIINNLPTWISMGKEFIARTQQMGKILGGFITNSTDIFKDFTRLLGATLSNLMTFDFLDTSGRVSTAFDELKLSVDNWGTGFEDAIKLLTTPLTEGIASGENARPTGTENTNEGAYETPAPYSGSGGNVGTKEQRAMLDAIAFAEGTSKYPNSGYNTHFAGDQTADLSRHPDIVKRSGRYASAAFGRYQFMPDTFNRLAKKLGLKDMSPASQDKAAIELARELGVTSEFLKREGMSYKVSAALGRQWASFPGKTIGLDQPTKELKGIQNVYQKSLGSSQQPSQSSPPAQTTSTPSKPVSTGKLNLIPQSGSGGFIQGGSGSKGETQYATHFHIDYKGNNPNAEQLANIREVAFHATKAMLARGSTVYYGNIKQFASGSDSNIRALIAAEQAAHDARSSAAVDIQESNPKIQRTFPSQAGSKTKFPFAVGSVSFRGGYGREAEIIGTSGITVSHGAAGSSASEQQISTQPPTPAQITPTGTPQNPQMSQSLAQERTGPTVIVSQNPSSPAQQMMYSGGGGSSGGGSPQISEFALLNNFMRNKLLLDLAYL
jgi:muramidase (phage lysozyme)